MKNSHGIEKITPVFLGGPMDGYNGMQVWSDVETIDPGPHHLREVGCKSKPFYKKVCYCIYRLAGYYE